MFLHLKGEMGWRWKAVESTVVKMKVFFMQFRTAPWNPFQQDVAKAKHLARASMGVDVYMKNESI